MDWIVNDIIFMIIDRKSDWIESCILVKILWFVDWIYHFDKLYESNMNWCVKLLISSNGHVYKYMLTLLMFWVSCSSQSYAKLG